MLVDYSSGRLSTAEAIALEEHFADCALCTGLARRVRLVERFLDRWTPVARCRREAAGTTVPGRAGSVWKDPNRRQPSP